MQVANLTADGVTANYRTAGHRSRGLSLIISGTWGSGTAKVQILVNGSWSDVPAATLTADGTLFVEWSEAATFRVDLSGSTTPALEVILGG